VFHALSDQTENGGILGEPKISRLYTTRMESEIINGGKHIRQLIESGKPFFVGRNGSTEMEVLYWWYTHMGVRSPLPQALIDKLSKVSGIWPATQESVADWVAAYVAALGSLDGVAAGWFQPFIQFEQRLLNMSCPLAFRTPLRSLEPYYVEPDNRWSAALEGKRVAVVSSFADTIQQQVAKLDGPWTSVASPETLLPPTTTWLTVRSHYPPCIAEEGPCAWPEGVDDWNAAVNYLLEKVLATGAKIALVGCGALGIILGARLKHHGVSVIVMGGAIQVLFGIKGKRWRTHSVISTFWNSEWVLPSSDETPGGAATIEGGCYWA
jgi:hypothetical protein